MHRKIFLTLFFVIQGLVVVKADSVFDPAQAKNIFATHYVVKQIQGFNRLSDTELLSKSTDLISDQATPDLVRERLLFEISLLLRSRPETPINQQINRRLLSYQSQAKWIQKDAGYRQPITAFPVAASARANTIHWHTQGIIDNITQEPNDITKRIINYLTGTRSVEKQMVLSGLLKTLSNQSKLDVGEEILRIQPKITSTCLLPIARELKSAGLYLSAINNYHYDRLFQARDLFEFSQISQVLPADEAQNVLLAMLSNNKLKAVAIQQMADFTDSGNVIPEKLFTLLADPVSGGDAAMALSKSRDLMILQRLESNLKSDNPVVVKRSLLTLELNASFTAKQILGRFIKTTEDKQLKTEVSRWLDAS